MGLFMPTELSLQKIFAVLSALDRHLKAEKKHILQICYKKLLILPRTDMN